MTSQVRIERRDGCRNPSQNPRPEWIPRGSNVAATETSRSGADSEPNVQHVGVVQQENPRRNGINSRGRPGPESEDNVDDGVARQGIGKDSSLPQLLQEIQEKLTKGKVDCMICYDRVQRSSAIWSCSSCYSIFHLNCIKRWAKAPSSIDLSVEKDRGVNWRCPGCQSVQLISSKEMKYLCFCGRRRDPPPDLYLTPHSCGEPCGRPLEKEMAEGGGREEDLCPHRCVLQCHPGPCPPCKAFAPPRLCPCGKKTVTTRCSDRRAVLTCGRRCEKLLECGRHRCEQICHVGPCGKCEAPFHTSCFCQKKAEIFTCGEMEVKGDIQEEDGSFSCNSTCGKKLSCGNHVCLQPCHPGSCGDCNSSPGLVRTCFCGKTSLKMERKTCLDPIPTCSRTCGKLLPCGIHLCPDPCHAGDCPPCKIPVSQKCRCGSSSRVLECHRAAMEIEKFTCDRSCGRKKNCGRHRCSDRCCPPSPPHRHRDGDGVPGDPHFCSMPCGKKLRCGRHACEAFCHSGHCPPCLETIFLDLTCACGKTSLPPPLPCGTPPPPCQLPCSAPRPCGHPPRHGCHFGDCPPCTVPVGKECLGGHVMLQNIPCGSKDIRCNLLCGKTRQCGLHACGRICHQPPCDPTVDSDRVVRASCRQPCGAPRRDCRHSCRAPCHPSAPCPDRRCDFPVLITCSCGRITATVPCEAGGDDTDEGSVIPNLPTPLEPIESNGKKIPLGQRKLTCDDDCARLERKKVLAEAFEISSPNLDALHFSDSAASEWIADLFRRDPKWVFSIEERCKVLVHGRSRANSAGVKVHVFSPMLKEKRDALLFIAGRWKLAVNPAGREPKRFIVVHVTPQSKTPSRVLGVKGTSTANPPPPFDPVVDMDPRLVVSLPDLPRGTDISASVLRFGGECELVWLNDNNALAIFHDPARAAAAMRRLDHGSIYNGAAAFSQARTPPPSSSPTPAWRGVTDRGNSWKKVVIQEASREEDARGEEESLTGSRDPPPPAWSKEASIAASSNCRNLSDPEFPPSSSPSTCEVDDWEKAYE